MQNELSIFKLKDKTVVLREVTREYYHQPNYNGTGKALTGILKEGETLAEFCTRRNLRVHNYKKS